MVDSPDVRGEEALSLLDLALLLARNARLLVIAPLAVGALAIGGTYLVSPTFTATTTFLPPQQPQSAAASALTSLGALSGLAGMAGGLKSPADQYVSLLQSVNVQDRLIDGFELMKVYRTKYRFEARQELEKNVRISLGKKDGLIKVEVDDEDPRRAAEIANRHVEELRRVTSELALTEAQQRRQFFEVQLKQTRDRLGAAQSALQSSGFTQGTLRAEPKAAAESYAKLKAELTAAEVRLQTLRGSLADGSPEVQQQTARLRALREQVVKMEGAPEVGGGPDYIGKYREFKYQETLFEMFARQYELARVDESREGSLIQVLDVATPPEKKSRPRRAVIGAVAGGATFTVLVVLLLLRLAVRHSSSDPSAARKLQELRQTFRRSNAT